MPQIIADKVSINLPLYSSISSVVRGGAPHSNRRILRNKKNKIIGVRALDNISFTVNAGERLAIIGKNGSGKTTLLQTLAGIIIPDEGQIIADGKCTNIISIQLGMQAEATGDQNILLRGLASGHERDEIENRREQISEFSGLGDFLSMPVKTYSSGMRMRLAFAIATAFEPEILILDEWLSAGDAGFRQSASQRMTEFADRASILILASHSLSLLRDVCTKALWLDDGKVIAIGELEDVIQQYEDWLEQQTNLAGQEKE